MSNHKLHTMYTANYRYSGTDRVDTTVKGQDPNWKEFAPTWDMVMGIKNDTMSEQQYIDFYDRIISRVSAATWGKLLAMETATFVCFDPKGTFCHRNIIVNYILKIMGDRVVYGGWRESGPLRGKRADKVLPILNQWAEFGQCDLQGVSESGEEVFGMFQADDIDNMRPGVRVGIMGYGFWVLGTPAS